MKTKEEIAQWIIDNRYPKSENDKVSDFEMYHHIVDNIDQNTKQLVDEIELVNKINVKLNEKITKLQSDLKAAESVNEGLIDLANDLYQCIEFIDGETSEKYHKLTQSKTKKQD